MPRGGAAVALLQPLANLIEPGFRADFVRFGARRPAHVVSQSPDKSAIGFAVDSYVNSRHREHPESGCSVATLGSELARENSAARHQMSENVKGWLERLAQFAQGSNAAEKMRAATGTYAAMIGGLIIARAVEDPHLSDRILADVREFLNET